MGLQFYYIQNRIKREDEKKKGVQTKRRIRGVLGVFKSEKVPLVKGTVMA
jgi:hypothetical protein